MTSVRREFALPVQNASLIVFNGGTGTEEDPYTAFLDFRYNKVFTKDITDLEGVVNIHFDTRSGSIVQNTGKLITLMFAGTNPAKTYQIVATFSSNFGPLGPIITKSLVSQQFSSSITLMSSGIQFTSLNTSEPDYTLL